MMISQSKPLFQKSDFDYINNIIKTGQIAKGAYLEQLQNEFSKVIGIRYSLSASSGTAALHLALLSLGIKEGDEVIIPSYACTALLNAVNYTGATSVLVDVDPETFNITRNIIKNKVTRKTKLIIVTHTFGFPADLDEIIKLGIPVIEDCAQALGSTYKGEPCGKKGIISIFSLYATKIVSGGEGGMVCTDDKRISGSIQDLNNYDARNCYRIRYNYKMSNLTAGIVLSQLSKLNSFVKRRVLIAQQYKKAFSFLPFEFQRALSQTATNYYRFIICSPLSNKIINFTQKHGVMCDRPIYRPLHRYLNYRCGDFKGTDYLWKRSVSIPIYPALSNKEILRIITTVRRSVSDVIH